MKRDEGLDQPPVYTILKREYQLSDMTQKHKIGDCREAP